MKFENIIDMKISNFQSLKNNFSLGIFSNSNKNTRFTNLYFSENIIESGSNLYNRKHFNFLFFERLNIFG